MTILDVALVLTVATLVALAAQRRLVGLMVGAGGALALRPLLMLGDMNPWLGLFGALLAGLGFALIGRMLLPLGGGRGWLVRLAGGAGGAVLGVAVVLTLVTSLPIQRDALNPNQLRYPSREIPLSVRPLVERSMLVQFGREVLFAPLLVTQEPRSREHAAVVSTLHDWIIVGEPWHLRPARPPTRLP